MSDYDTVKVTKDNLTELLAKANLFEAYHRGRYDGLENRLRKYIASLRKGQGPHISRYVVMETLTNILEGEE